MTAALLAAVALAIAALALVPAAADAKSCRQAIPEAYDLRANKHVKCKKSRRVSVRSFDKIRSCLRKGHCRASGFRCRPRTASSGGQSGGKMVCRKGKGKVTYGFGA